MIQSSELFSQEKVSRLPARLRRTGSDCSTNLRCAWKIRAMGWSDVGFVIDRFFSSGFFTPTPFEVVEVDHEAP